MITKNKIKILFITRAHPTAIGGIQKQNHELAHGLADSVETRVIFNKMGRIALPLFFFSAFFQAIFHARRYDVILLGDGVLAILGFLLKFLSKKPVACILHGLDVTYKNVIYQKLWIGFFLKKMDRLIAVGNETIRQGIKHGLPEDLFIFVPNGVSPAENIHQKNALEKMLGHSLPGPTLLTLGRLVKRKGVEWFLTKVMPELPGTVSYIIAGDGKEKSAIQKAITKHQLQKRVRFLGSVTAEEKSILLSAADVFVQPNIYVSGDMEGFGLVVLEAAAHGTPVVASNIEGLKDAIHDDRNGLLVPSGDVAAYVKTLVPLLQNPQKRQDFGRLSQKYVLENFSWISIASRYIDVLDELLISQNKTCT